MHSQKLIQRLFGCRLVAGIGFIEDMIVFVAVVFVLGAEFREQIKMSDNVYDWIVSNLFVLGKVTLGCGVAVPMELIADRILDLFDILVDEMIGIAAVGIKPAQNRRIILLAVTNRNGVHRTDDIVECGQWRNGVSVSLLAFCVRHIRKYVPFCAGKEFKTLLGVFLFERFHRVKEFPQSAFRAGAAGIGDGRMDADAQRGKAFLSGSGDHLFNGILTVVKGTVGVQILPDHDISPFWGGLQG